MKDYFTHSLKRLLDFKDLIEADQIGGLEPQTLNVLIIIFELFAQHNR